MHDMNKIPQDGVSAIYLSFKDMRIQGKREEDMETLTLLLVSERNTLKTCAKLENITFGTLLGSAAATVRFQFGVGFRKHPSRQ